MGTAACHHGNCSFVDARLSWQGWCANRAFESAGLPSKYREGISDADPIAQTITTYVGAPNPVNMLNAHLGRIVHVLIPLASSWTCLAPAIVSDVAKLMFWLSLVFLATSSKQGPPFKVISMYLPCLSAWSEGVN